MTSKLANRGLVVLLAIACPAAFAQAEPDTDAYDGKWVVNIVGDKTRVHAADLVVGDFAGSWRDVGKGSQIKGSACRGKKFPITVQVSQRAKLAFTVWGSAVSPTCPDLSVELKPVDAKTLEGTIGNDQRVLLTRR